MFSGTNMPSAKTVVSTAASVAASAMVVRSIARELFPSQLQYYIFYSIRSFIKSFSSELTLVIDEFDGLSGNQIYKAADIYLGTKIPPSTKKFKVSMPEKETNISISMDKNQEVTDIFNGVQFKWMQVSKQIETNQVVSYSGQSSTARSEIRHFELTFHKKHKNLVLDSYFPFILNESKLLKEEKKTLKIYTLSADHVRRYTPEAWHSISLDHPSTFDTLAMETELKKTLMEDLERFVKRKEYYKRVGKAWKRGYLLYGPPGTGKSSLIAAMANYLKFDIYDLELTSVHQNSDLRRLLISTKNKSILVVEDIDCSLDMQDNQQSNVVQANQVQSMFQRLHRGSQVTLSGLLNFIDGLWSSCGDERIIVFTTNHKDRLDPALLRPGRMDVHIHMSYCTPCGFKTLAVNYLGVNEHPLFAEVEKLMKGTVMVTPAEVGEQLLKNEDPGVALKGLVEFLRAKKEIEESPV